MNSSDQICENPVAIFQCWRVLWLITTKFCSIRTLCVWACLHHSKYWCLEFFIICIDFLFKNFYSYYDWFDSIRKQQRKGWATLKDLIEWKDQIVLRNCSFPYLIFILLALFAVFFFKFVQNCALFTSILKNLIKIASC